jgi:hypothetical protein
MPDNASIGLGSCMVRFINHNDRELIGIEPGEASGAAPAEGWNRGYNDIASFRCALSGLLDLHFEIGIGGKQFVTSLMEQLCAMSKDQHASLHAEERRELRKNDGLAGASGETDELTSCARFISVENRGEALALIIAQEDWRLHDAEYTSLTTAPFFYSPAADRTLAPWAGKQPRKENTRILCMLKA